MSGIRRLFRTGRGSAQAHSVPHAGPGRLPDIDAEAAAGQDGAAATATLLAPAPFEDLVATLGQLRARLADDASGVSEIRAALAPLAQMPDSLNELRRSALTLNESVAEHAERSRRNGDSTLGLLQRVGDALAGQVEVASAMQQQLDGALRTFAGFGEELDRLRGSLGQIADSGARTATSLAALVESQARRELAVVAELRRFRGWTVGLLAAAVMATVMATVVVAVRG